MRNVIRIVLQSPEAIVDGSRWMWWKYIIMIIWALAAGGVIAGAYVALIASLGVYTRLEAWSGYGRWTMRLETIILLGTITGNILTLYDIRVLLGQAGLLVSGLFFGIFTGCLAAALADMVKLFPILCRRVKLRRGLPYIIAATGLGKTVGCLIQFFWFSSPM
jgi:stage V sporulation protein AB